MAQRDLDPIELGGSDRRPMCIIDAQTRLVAGNDALARAVGCATTELVGRSFATLVRGNAATHAALDLHAATRAGGNAQLECEIADPVAGRRWYEWQFTALDTGPIGGRRFRGVATDITTLKLTRQHLDELQRRHDSLIDALSQPYWLIRDGFCAQANGSARALVDAFGSGSLGRFQDLVAVTDRERVADTLAAIVATPGRSEAFSFRLGNEPSVAVRIDVAAASILFDGQPAVQILGSVVAREEPGAEVGANAVLRDPVTGLPTRVLFREELDRACRRSRRFGTRILLVRIDIDPCSQDGRPLDLKTLDRLAIALDARLTDTVRETDYVGRFGPRAFALLGIDVAQMQDVTRLGERIAAAVGTSIVIDEVEWSWRMRMGGTLYPDDHAQPDLLVAHAEAALVMTEAEQTRELRLHPAAAAQTTATSELMIDFAAE